MTEEEVTAPPAVPPAVDKLVEMYIHLRDKKAARKKKYEEDVAAIDAGMAKLEGVFITAMRQQGLTSLPTKAGTPYMSNKTSVTVADPAIYYAWVLENPDRAAFLDIKANKTAVLAWKEENNDLPPGLNYREEINVNVRR
jgi:hypothetical protein